MPPRRRRSRRSYRHYDDYPPYIPVAQRRAEGKAIVAELRGEGQTVRPVRIEGRTIASTVWGKAWCSHLEGFSDYANRLPRGRTYVRHGAVVDLSVEPSYVRARVAGSSLYRVEVGLDAIEPARWQALVDGCAAEIHSVVDLLRGALSPAVMQRVCDRESGLFPDVSEMEFACSCPDYASMCKHVAAVLYGVGARLDEDPGLLFTLRLADPAELVRAAGVAAFAAPDDAIDEGDLGDIFGIDLDGAEPSEPSEPAPAEITAEGLAARGVPRSRIQSWLRSGVLGRSGRRGVYLATERSGPAIADYLAGR